MFSFNLCSSFNKRRKKNKALFQAEVDIHSTCHPLKIDNVRKNCFNKWTDLKERLFGSALRL